jgi:dipeptidyl aminopeptidase/acylaminoacyl peptidase
MPRWLFGLWGLVLVLAGLTAPARAQVGAGEEVTLAGDGVALPARLYRPATPGPRPAVVLAPGGLAQGSIEGFEWLATRLVARDYVVLTITYRNALPLDDPRDVALALDFLQADPQVDRDRLAIVGHSRGGMSALRTLALDPRLRAGVALAPPADLQWDVIGTATFAPSRHRQLVDWLGGEPRDVRDLLATISAITYADRIRQPVLLVHGTGDMTAPPDHSVYMARALEQHGNDRVRLELIPGMGHFFELQTAGYQFDRVAELVAGWLAEVLGVS